MSPCARGRSRFLFILPMNGKDGQGEDEEWDPNLIAIKASGAIGGEQSSRLRNTCAIWHCHKTGKSTTSPIARSTERIKIPGYISNHRSLQPFLNVIVTPEWPRNWSIFLLRFSTSVNLFHQLFLSAIVIPHWPLSSLNLSTLLP